MALSRESCLIVHEDYYAATSDKMIVHRICYLQVIIYGCDPEFCFESEINIVFL
jgi:hypothetical protein